MPTAAATSDRSVARWRAASAIGLGLLFLVAATAKIVSIFAFRASLDMLLAERFSGSRLPLGSIRDVTVIVVISIEAMLGLSLILCSRRPHVPAMVAGGLLALFSVYLALSTQFANTAPCGCLGAWEPSAADARLGAWFGLARNASLIVLCVWLSRDSNNRSFMPRRAIAGTRPGFSLVELLVVIAILAVVIGLTLPFLGGVRKQAQTANSLSAQRQYSTALAQYVIDEAGYLPFLAVVGQPERGVLPERTWPDGAPSYFRGHSRYWLSAFRDRGIDVSMLPQNELVGENGELITTYVWLTHAANARPEYWEGVDPPNNMFLFAGGRLDEITFPSNKGLLANVGLLEEQSTTWDVSMGDGSASVQSVQDPPIRIDGLPRPWGCVPWRVLTTPLGLRGRDY